jgi:hypothetical protein
MPFTASSSTCSRTSSLLRPRRQLLLQQCRWLWLLLLLLLCWLRLLV